MFRTIASILIIVMLFLVVPAVFAGSASASASLTSSSPIMTAHGGHYYNECLLTVSGAGSHTATFSGISGMPTDQPIALFYPQGGFDPTNYIANFLGFTLDGESITLNAGTYTTVLTTNTGASGNGGVFYQGSYTINISGPGAVELSCSGGGGGGGHVPDDDPDGDGISGSRDNCPYDFNPDQEDGWGSDMGDLCDTEWYNTNGMGVSGFEGKDGIYNVYGNCYVMPDGEVRCLDVGSFDPDDFQPDAAPVDVTTEYADGWRVMVYYLHSNHGADVYQVNIYDENDVLVDDRLEIHVYGDDSWQWYHRGGEIRYNGI